MSSTLSEQVAELEAERNEYRAERELEERRGDLLRQAYDYSVAERDQLKRQAEAWEHAERQATRVPRVITADELREGQLVAIHRGHSWGVRAIGIFREISDEKITLKMGNGESFKESIKFHTLVLLAEAPEPTEPELHTEPGSVILVTEWRGEKLDPPIYAVVDGHGDFIAVKGHTFPDECSYAETDEITGWKPARIVVEDGE